MFMNVFDEPSISLSSAGTWPDEARDAVAVRGQRVKAYILSVIKRINRDNSRVQAIRHLENPGAGRHAGTSGTGTIWPNASDKVAPPVLDGVGL